MRVVAWRDSFFIISIFLLSLLLVEPAVTEIPHFQLLPWRLIGLRVAPPKPSLTQPSGNSFIIALSTFWILSSCVLSVAST